MVTRDASEKSWHWITGEEFSYTHWDDGEPTYKYENTDSDEIYIGIYANDTATDYSTTGMWNDFRPNTDTIKGFVCEWDTLGFKKSTSNWSTPEIQEAYENDLIPEFLVEEDLKENISRAEFASVSLKLYEALTGETVTSEESLPFNDVDGLENYSDIQKAYKLDIAVGTSPVTFEPYADINREQLVTMLTRTLKKYKYPEWTIETDSEYALLAGSVSKKFDDDEDISDFARDSVYYMSEMGIVTGVDANHFAPKNTTVEQEAEGYAAATREQALALSLRILKKADLL
ncbi:MAG: S-layer homology domain-containing protein [Clostridiales bacterium]|nr:S-layer homology domain-containing protein [Clostridiales bacterium]